MGKETQMAYSFEVKNGSLSVTADGNILFSDVTGYLKYEDNDYNVITVPREGEWHPLPRGGEVVSESFWFSPCKDILNGLESHAGTAAEIAGANPSTRDVPMGFCTWYYYGNKISRDKVMQNVAVAREKYIINA